MDDYKKMMTLLESIGAFEKTTGTLGIERALAIAKNTAQEERRRAQSRTNWLTRKPAAKVKNIPAKVYPQHTEFPLQSQCRRLS